LEHLILFSLSLIIFSANLYFLGLLWFTDKHDSKVRSLIAMGVATCYWVIFDATDGIAQSFAYSYLYSLRSVMLVIAPMCFLWYVLYLSNSRLAGNRTLGLIMIIVPTIDIILVLTNPAHRLVFAKDGVPLPEYGPLFVFHSAVAYAAILFGVILLFRYIAKTRPPALFAVGWILCCMIPIVVNVLFTIGIISMDQDIAPFGFASFFILFSLYSYRSRLTNLKSVALSDAFNSYSDGILLFDSHKDILEDVSEAFQKYFPDCSATVGQTTADEILNYFMPRINNEDSAHRFELLMTDWDESSKREIALPNAEGELKTYNVSTRDVHGSGGKITGWLCSFTDVSDYRRMIAEINEQNARLAVLREQAETASEAKSTFLANMSHEMRTPLNAIIGLSEVILHKEAIDIDTRSSISKIHDSGVGLLGVLGNVLDIAKIESGKFEIVAAGYNTAVILSRTAGLYDLKMKEAGLDFIVHVDERLPQRLHGDELRVRQIFHNLLSNALKYTEAGSVTLSVSFEEDTGKDAVPESGFLKIAIADTGIGIRDEDIENIFTEYHQVDMKINRRDEGAGLGLSIIRRLIYFMDGYIEVESRFGEGSTFTAVFRQGIDDPKPIGAETAGALETLTYAALERDEQDAFTYAQMPFAKVLIVDDIEINLEVARGMLEPYGLTIDCIMSGQEAIDLIRSGEPHYDIIFMDQMMPGLDGLETVRIIREEIGTEYALTIPVVALTANATVGSKEMFLRNGFQDFLAKPINYKVMNSILLHWIANRG
jgi:signal transduction histidine kinase/ActR/RegA family two-component response regulator